MPEFIQICYDMGYQGCACRNHNFGSKTEQMFEKYLTFSCVFVTIKPEQMFESREAHYGYSGEFVNPEKA